MTNPLLTFPKGSRTESEDVFANLRGDLLNGLAQFLGELLDFHFHACKWSGDPGNRKGILPQNTEQLRADLEVGQTGWTRDRSNVVRVGDLRRLMSQSTHKLML